MWVTTDECDLLCIDFDHAERLRAELPGSIKVASASTRLKALGDPTRFAIAYALERGDELCVCDLAWIIGCSQGLVSHHLRQLRTSGLATSRKDGKLVMYRLTEDARHLLAAVSERVEKQP